MSLTYADLDRRARALAVRLGEAGVGPGDPVGVLVERTPALVVGLLGVLYAGGAYVPLDPSTPRARMAFMLADAGVRVVVASDALRDSLPAGPPIVSVDRAGPDRPDTAEGADRSPAAGRSLAYVIYTSGTTGQPKGVAVEHASVVRLMDAMRDRLGVGPDDTVLGLTTPAFDLSVPDLFLPLTTGAHLLLASPSEAADPDRLAGLMDRATLAQATPATWRMLVDAGWAGTPRLTAVSGGDVLPPTLADTLAPRVRALWNFYGPTEATVWATSARVEAGRAPGLGDPFPGVTVTLCDEALRPVAEGETGEICIGGWGLARGSTSAGPT